MEDKDERFAGLDLEYYRRCIPPDLLKILMDMVGVRDAPAGFDVNEIEGEGGAIMTGKFRIWDGVRMWYYREDSEDGDSVNYMIAMDGSLWVRSSNFVFSISNPDAVRMFATGHTIKDTDGNDRVLYYGDIVEWRGADEGYSANISEIVWDIDLCQYARQLGIGWKIGLNQRVCPQLTLLGNRYENPELLEGGGE